MDSDDFQHDIFKMLGRAPSPKAVEITSSNWLYDISSDMYDHLLVFESTLSYKEALALIMCHAFPLLLKSTLLKFVSIFVAEIH